MDRFNQLMGLIEFVKPKIFTEAGIGNLDLTIRIIDTLLKFDQPVLYFGLGLKEHSKAYNDKLKNLRYRNKNLNYFIIDLGSNIDLAKSYEYKVGDEFKTSQLLDTEFLFCNHLFDVQDFSVCVQGFQKAAAIVMDRVLHTDNEEIAKTGCNLILNQIPHILLPKVDNTFENGKILNVQMAVTGPVINHVKIEGVDKPIKGNGGSPNQINIQTRNSLPNETIQKQVEENILFAREHGIEEVRHCFLHDNYAYLIGGSISFKEEEKMNLLREAYKDKKSFIFTSKTAHDYLLDNGIVPFGCILLDPRDHVPGFLDRAHKDILYIVASQTHPDTLKILHSKGVNCLLYHAGVNAGEADVMKRLNSTAPLIGGGSTSVTRGIGVLNVLGFHKFRLFGIDSSYPEKPEKVHGINQQKQAIEVDMTDPRTNQKIGHKYWTDPELIAQANDIEMILKNWHHVTLENYSEGMSKAIFEYLNSEKKTFAEFLDRSCKIKIG